MLQAIRNAFILPDLRRRLLFTFLILVIYRLASHVPVPGIDPERLSEVFASNQLLGFLDLLSGGAMSSFSVMALGVYPYITASIIMQLLQPIIPQLEELAKEGKAGRNKINQYTHLLTIPLAFLHGFGQATLLQRQGVISNFGLAPATLLPTLATLTTLTTGTVFAIWLGELISEQGIGNGISLIIFGGIVARIPQNVGGLWLRSPWTLWFFSLITVITVAVIVIVQEGHRRIPVRYAKRVRGTKMYGGQSTHIPLPINSAGMIPLIFAQSILIFPGVVASYFRFTQSEWVNRIASGIYDVFNTASNVYWILYFLMVIGFTYFYADMVFQQQNLAENLKRQGGSIPGIRLGKTADYLNRVVRHITLVGALFLGAVAILPWLVKSLISDPQGGVGTMLITSTGLLIVVGVVLDTRRQLDAELKMRGYK